LRRGTFLERGAHLAFLPFLIGSRSA
jgi:hypothetical protein